MIIHQIHTVGKNLWSDGRGWILLVISAGWLLTFGGRLTFPALLPYLRTDFGLSLTIAGVFLTTLWSSYAIGGLPGGILADRIGERNGFVSGMAVVTLGMVLVITAQTPVMLFIGVIIFGLGAGLFATPRFTVLSDIYPEQDGTALGVSAAAGNIGNAGLPVIAAVITSYIGWRFGFGFMIPLFLLVGLGLWITVPKRTSVVTALSRETVKRIATVITDPAVLLITAAMTMFSFIYQGFTGFYPTYLVDVKGLGAATAAIFFGVFFATGMIVQILAGISNDQFGPKPTLLTLIFFTTIGLFLLPFLTSVIGLLVLTIGLAVLLGFFPVSVSYSVAALPSDIQGSGFGIVRTVFNLIGATGPILVGSMGEVGRFDHAVFALAGIGIVAFLVCTRLPWPPDTTHTN